MSYIIKVNINWISYINCDKFYIYNEYRAEILRLGTNPNNGKSIRQQLTGTNKDELEKRVIAQIIKNQEEGIQEKHINLMKIL